MDNSALLNEFLIESFENLSSINNDLTQLEKNAEDKELLNKIYRTVHTMKGSASFLGFKKLQEITHSAENLLDELREEKFTVNPVIIDTLLQTFDICNSLLKSIEDNGQEGDVEIDANKAALEKILDSTAGDSADETATPVPIESASDNELTNLISNHKEPSISVEASEAAVDDGAVSSAALDSLKELVGEGKVDAAMLAEFESAPAETSESVKEGEELSAAALESLKELIGEGKIESGVLAELEGSTKSAPAPAVEVENEVSDAALASLQELIGEGKVESSALEGLSSKANIAKEPEAKEPEAKEPEAKEPEAKKEIPAPPAKKAVPSAPKTSISDSFVRVNVKVLDTIMNVVGELVLNRNQIVQYSNTRSEREFTRLAQQLNVITTELQSEVMSTRMQQIGSILTKFERLVRDFSRTSGKKINLKLLGEGTELDKTLIEAIKDPLVHIIRNACDHGMETFEEREETNKPIEGTILIKSYNESGQVTIEIVDDGRGLDRAKIGGKAVEKGVITQERFDQMSDTQVYNLIFAPGFSTADKITNISGRGVGMDVVKTNIEKIGGTVSVNSELGTGSTFKLRIPLTLAIVPALVIKSSHEAFAIPQLNLMELVRLETPEDKANIETIQGSEFLKLRGELTPVFRLADKLNLIQVHENTNALRSVVVGNEIVEEIKKPTLVSQSQDEAFNIVILKAEGQVFGVIVDEVLDTEEIVVKPLNSNLKQLSLFGGATIMGDGTVALILDALGFLNTVSEGRTSIGEKEENNFMRDTEVIEGQEVQENLLFKLYDDREYAVPLSLVSRLEEFSFKDVEMTGDQPIVRYLDAPMPLINIESTLQLDGTSILEAVKSNEIGTLSCIVASLRGKNYGIIVKEVLDISIDNVAIDDTAVDREGILGTVFIQNRTISLIDLYSVIESQKIGPQNAKVFDFDTNAKNKKILVVDDSPMYRKLESDLLSRVGYTVETATNGEEGFHKFSQGGYDLLLTDIEMPKLTGYELAKKIRTELKNKEIPIIALSTRFSERDQEKGRDAGFTHHLEKLKNYEVIDIINELLAGK